MSFKPMVRKNIPMVAIYDIRKYIPMVTIIYMEYNPMVTIIYI